jgi:hypothetical protein
VKLPAVVNVTLKVLPWAMVSLLERESSSKVTVWSAPSLLVHVTVSPTAISIGSGVKEKSSIETSVVPSALPSPFEDAARPAP